MSKPKMITYLIWTLLKNNLNFLSVTLKGFLHAYKYNVDQGCH